MRITKETLPERISNLVYLLNRDNEYDFDQNSSVIFQLASEVKELEEKLETTQNSILNFLDNV